MTDYARLPNPFLNLQPKETAMLKKAKKRISARALKKVAKKVSAARSAPKRKAAVKRRND